MPTSENAPTYPLLVVEDDPVQRRIIVTSLVRFGWKIIEAENGARGLEAIRSREGVVALTDINMPVMDGIEMLRQAGEERVRAVAMTAANDSATVIRAFNVGVTDYVIKPMDDWQQVNTLLRKADTKLFADRNRRKEMHALQQQADWQYWKALFLTGGQNSEMQRVLDMMHVQFNQDIDYNQMLETLMNLRVDGGFAKLPEDIYHTLLAAIAPIARFASGIRIAQSVIHKAPTLHSVTVAEFMDILDSLYRYNLNPNALLNMRNLSLWIAEGARSVPGYVYLDSGLFEAAITELTINAFKYSAPSDAVDINVQAAAGENIQILITNPARETTLGRDGKMLPGLPRELEELAFRFFIRLSPENLNTYQEQWPMGLGLPLARQVMSQHGGRISVHNESWHLGGGSGNAPQMIVACRVEIPVREKPLPIEEKA